LTSYVELLIKVSSLTKLHAAKDAFSLNGNLLIKVQHFNRMEEFKWSSRCYQII